MSATDYTWVRIKGDSGRPLYTWIKFSRYEDGRTPDGVAEISDSPHDKLYMGIAENQHSKKASANPSDYRWIKVGSDSVVVDKFTWFRFADDDKGTNISSVAQGKAYIGISENRLTRTPSDNPNDYTWIKVAGDVNITGTTLYTWIKYSPFHDGRAMTDYPESDTRFMGLATNKVDEIPSVQPIDYNWVRVKDSDGKDIKEDLATLDRQTYVHYAYSRFAGGFDPASGTPSFEPDVTKAKYVGLVVNYPSEAPPTDPKLYVWTGIPVAGKQGEKGEKGDLQYMWLKFSDHPNGTDDSGKSVMFDEPDNHKYMGIALNKPTPTPSVHAGNYKWIKLWGESGEKYYTWVAYGHGRKVTFKEGAVYTDTYNPHIDGFVYPQLPTYNRVVFDKAGMTHMYLSFNRDTPILSDNANDYEICVPLPEMTPPYIGFLAKLQSDLKVEYSDTISLEYKDFNDDKAKPLFRNGMIELHGNAHIFTPTIDKTKVTARGGVVADIDLKFKEIGDIYQNMNIGKLDGINTRDDLLKYSKLPDNKIIYYEGATYNERTKKFKLNPKKSKHKITIPISGVDIKDGENISVRYKLTFKYANIIDMLQTQINEKDGVWDKVTHLKSLSDDERKKQNYRFQRPLARKAHQTNGRRVRVKLGKDYPFGIDFDFIYPDPQNQPFNPAGEPAYPTLYLSGGNEEYKFGKDGLMVGKEAYKTKTFLKYSTNTQYEFYQVYVEEDGQGGVVFDILGQGFTADSDSLALEVILYNDSKNDVTEYEHTQLGATIGIEVVEVSKATISTYNTEFLEPHYKPKFDFDWLVPNKLIKPKFLMTSEPVFDESRSFEMSFNLKTSYGEFPIIRDVPLDAEFNKDTIKYTHLKEFSFSRIFGGFKYTFRPQNDYPQTSTFSNWSKSDSRLYTDELHPLYEVEIKNITVFPFDTIHVRITYDSTTGVSNIYINHEQVATTAQWNKERNTKLSIPISPDLTKELLNKELQERLNQKHRLEKFGSIDGKKPKRKLLIGTSYNSGEDPINGQGDGICYISDFCMRYWD